MSKTRLRPFLLLLFPVFFLLASCSRPDDTVIRETITAFKTNAEAGNWDELMTHISKHYKDKDNNNYFIINQMIRNYTAGVTEMKVDIEIMGVNISEKEAQAQVKMVVQGKKGGNMFFVVGRPDAPEYPRLYLAKEGRQWRLIKVEGIRGNEDNQY